MDSKKVIHTTVLQSEALAKSIGQTVVGGEVFALVGPLGSGKTTFVKHLARQLGFTKPVTSPTFVLQQTYPAKTRLGKPILLQHFDLYRLDTKAEITDSGLTEYWGDPTCVCLVEWADRAKSLLPPATTTIVFTSL